MKKEDLNKEVRQFLGEQVIAAVATVSDEGEPRVSTMYYYTDDDFNFYFITAKDSQKLKNIEANNRVAIAVGFGPATITIQASGTALINYDFKGEFVDKVFKKIGFKNLDQWPVLQLEKGGLVLLKVKPQWLVLLNFDKEGHPNTYSHTFHQIIPERTQ